MQTAATFELLRPFLWLAALAFLLGFVSYLAVGGPRAASVQAARPAPAAMVSGPASDDWNLPKRI